MSNVVLKKQDIDFFYNIKQGLDSYSELSFGQPVEIVPEKTPKSVANSGENGIIKEEKRIRNEVIPS